MTDQSTRKRGRPRTKPAGEVHVSVPLPRWLLEHIDAIGPNGGPTVAKLYMVQLARTTHTDGLTRKLEDILYG
jgi:hypothetical protein